MLVMGTKKGSLQLFHVESGQFIAEIENSHYLAISDLDVSPARDLLATGGKDTKVRLWVLADLCAGSNRYINEFCEAGAEITAVKFAPMG